MKFGDEVFGGAGAPLSDDEGNPLVAKTCPDVEHRGQHIWVDGAGVRCYCAGPEERGPGLYPLEMP
jgi:hypothetical protein